MNIFAVNLAVSIFNSEAGSEPSIEDLFHHGSPRDDRLAEDQVSQGISRALPALFSLPLLGEKCSAVRSGGSRLCLPHSPGLPGARLHGPRGGGLHLQQEPGGQDVRLRQDEGGHMPGSSRYFEIFLTKWEPFSTLLSRSS